MKYILSTVNTRLELDVATDGRVATAKCTAKRSADPAFEAFCQGKSPAKLTQLAIAKGTFKKLEVRA